MARLGLYPDAPTLPAVVGYEVAGNVDAVGDGVSRAVGERVLAITRFGGYSDVLGHLLGGRRDTPRLARAHLAWQAEGKMHPTVGARFSFAEAAAAHHYIQDRKNVGKVVLIP